MPLSTNAPVYPRPRKGVVFLNETTKCEKTKQIYFKLKTLLFKDSLKLGLTTNISPHSVAEILLEARVFHSTQWNIPGTGLHHHGPSLNLDSKSRYFPNTLDPANRLLCDKGILLRICDQHKLNQTWKQ